MKNTIDIEKIMTEIRQEIADRHLTPDMLSFADVPVPGPQVSDAAGWNSPEAQNALTYLNSRCVIQPYKELAGNPLAVFLKKVIRKLIKFYIEPIAEEQSVFNANTAHLFNALDQQENSGSIREIASRLDVLEAQVRQLQNENAALRRQLEEKKA